jgi:two-component system nitrogen regulation sensor histidine kinase NtrY
MEPQDMRELVKEAVFLFQVSNPQIDFEIAVPDQPVAMAVDRRLIGQALTNLVKNATEAIGTYTEQADREADYKGRIEASVSIEDGKVTVAVTDNGIGLPKKDRSRLVEPYVTTRSKGTGIGLAVVLRVSEQHGGQLKLEDAPARNGHSHGASVKMILPFQAGLEKSLPERRVRTGEQNATTGVVS